MYPRQSAAILLTAFSTGAGLCAALTATLAHPGKGEGRANLLIAAALTASSFVLALISLACSRRRIVTVPAFASALVGTITVFSLYSSMRQTVNALKCPWHLTQIGLALTIYSQSHNGKLPPSLEYLVTSGIVPPESLICDHSPDTPATGPALATELARPGHNSNIYLGDNRNFSDFAPEDILAYDRPSNHDNEGVHILAADGHSEWIPLASLPDALTRRKPRPNQPTSRPST